MAETSSKVAGHFKALGSRQWEDANPVSETVFSIPGGALKPP